MLESPRGIADATLGAFSDVVRRADLIVLLGKALDFTTRWAAGTAFDPKVRVIAIDPEAALVERAAREMDGRLACSAASRMSARGRNADRARRDDKDARRRLAHGSARRARQPSAAWATVVSQTPGRLHPARSVSRIASLSWSAIPIRC